MHLSDSITLSVRNPPPRTQSPKKSDAKVVANILATRGITVTATPKPKEKSSPSKESSAPTPSVAINLNSAVSIIPTAKNNVPSTNNKVKFHLSLFGDMNGGIFINNPATKNVNNDCKLFYRVLKKFISKNRDSLTFAFALKVYSKICLLHCQKNKVTIFQKTKLDILIIIFGERGEG